MSIKEDVIQQLVSSYYSEKVTLHGPNFKGADWGSLNAQLISFEQLIKLLPPNNSSLLDYGCGYGALYDYVREHRTEMKYTGFDISPEMINHAKGLHKNNDSKWINELPENVLFDYIIACGIFSVKLDIPVTDWEAHTIATLEKINSISKKGFAFNSLTSYSDTHLMKDNLYYPDPCFLFDYCKKHFSKYVSLIHDYPKYEFVIIVRKDVA